MSYSVSILRKKNVLITYDYELYFGIKSGTVWGSVIHPTNVILDCMDKNGQVGVFFVDWLMIKYLSEQKDTYCVKDLQLINKQLVDIVRRGHRIELHLHPHWIDAKYNGDGTWDFSNFTHYSLSSLPANIIEQMFIEGTQYLNEIAREVDPSYCVVAFRAGGWAVQPFDKIRKGMQASGLKIDSSVAYGTCAFNKTYSFDFRNAPKVRNGFYHVKDDVCITSEDSEILEVPITSYKRKTIYKIIDRLASINKSNFKCLTDGTHQRYDKNVNGEVILQPTRMYFYLTCFLNLVLEILSSDNEVFCFNDHPKDLTKMTIKGLNAISHITQTIDYRYFLKK